MHGARVPPGAAPQGPRRRIDYVTLLLDSISSISRQGEDPTVDLSKRSDDHVVVMADAQVSSAGPVRATSSWAQIPRDQKQFQGAGCAAKFAIM
eukprot:687706-Pyramimonas_sp.AAC.1